MTAEFPQKLPCVDNCPFSKQCGTHLILDSQPCKNSVGATIKNLKKIFPDRTLDAKSNSTDGIKIVSTHLQGPLWIVRAKNPNWKTEATYINGELQS